jgi:4-O-beta-D-mannosyl-D-glucose phosphorylase
MATFYNHMASDAFRQRLRDIQEAHESLITRPNEPAGENNGVYQRWKFPILTAGHTPLHWRYDFDEQTNPYFMERQGVNAAFNSGAMYHEGKYLLVVRVEGNDRKSFFGIATSPNGVDNFRFRDYPLVMPETEEPDTNVYDMRLTLHEDGWIYGLFCTERKDRSRPDDTTAAVAACGIARTRDLVKWERLPDLISHSGQQRNVVLHPEFVDGQYALYTRPQDGFIDVGKGGGIGWGLSASMKKAEVTQEIIIDPKVYHTIKEVKNGQGPTPLKTDKGWLHLAHGVRNTAAGLRYVLYLFLTDLQQPWRITHLPAGHFLSPQGDERVGDVSNVAFSNGWIANDNGEVFIYYGASDTRMHVATTTIERLLDYVQNTPADRLRSAVSVQERIRLIERNMRYI